IVDSARAIRRRDAVLAMLRVHGAPEWAVRPGEVSPAPARVDPNDRGVVILNVETIPAQGASSAPPSGAPASVAPSSSPPPAR
ncbi:MAG: hypothetical protein WCJ30_04810, partial [Deltaproteobacteria bacterium]